MFERGERSRPPDPPDADAIADFDVRLWVDGPGQPETRVPAAIRDNVRAMDTPTTPPTASGAAGPADRRAADERLADLRCPVLAIAGALDVSEVAQPPGTWRRRLPNAHAVVWPASRT